MAKNIKTPTHTDIIKSKAVLVKLKRAKMSRNKMDKDLSQFVADHVKATEEGAVRVNKSIFTKASTQEYMDIYNEASKYYYKVTLPWDDKGYRLLSVKIFKEFTKKFKDFTTRYRQVVNTFIDGIEGHIEEAKALLGTGWKAEDYKFLSANGGIDRSWLMDQFNLEVEFGTVTGKDDLRAEITEDDREAIAEQIEARSLEKFAKSQESVVIRVKEVVGKMHERLCSADATFRDTLVPNVEELIDIIPALNITGDAAINRLADECRKKLLNWDCQTLRDDPEKREEVSQAADKILKQAEGLI